jgi:transposase
MVTPIDDNEWWTLIGPLLPQPEPWRKKNRGRFSESDRATLSGILYVFKSGLRGNHFPISQVFGPFATRRRRLRDWH